MMKWKVVRNQPRSQSADRSLECLKKSENNNNNGHNDSNNNVGEEGKENKAPAKESNRQRASSLVRKTAVLTTECINLRSILGLARQRSETNLSSVGLVQPPEPARRSRSEVRLAAGCQTRSTSPPAKPSVGWLRGRKRERESRKSEANDVTSGKTVVTGSQRKKRSAGTNKECRTTADSSGDRTKGPRKSKNRRKEEDIIEEEDIYVEIVRREEDRQAPQPRRVGRKKGQAPRPGDPVRASPTRRRSSRKNTDRTVRSIHSLVCEEVLGHQPTTVVAEVHEELLYLSMDHNTARNSEYESLQVPDEPVKAVDQVGTAPDEVLPFHIDTPDYSTLESANDDAPREVDVVEPDVTPDPEDKGRSEGKTVQFGKMDLIDQYRRHKTAEEDSIAEDSFDVNECHKAADREEREDEVAASAVVRSGGEDSPNPFVVKKSFVLTIAKQEKGFQSLCANKKPEPPPAPPPDQISVTFRCSDCPAVDVRKRSTSVPPVRNPLEGLPSLPTIRGRSRDRKSKERRAKDGKKSKGRKKDSTFVMPQAVIDELSQVLEKRKPSLDEMPTPFLHQHPSSP